MKSLLLSLFMLSTPFIAFTQNLLVNGDLESTATCDFLSTASKVPDNWSNVSGTDPICRSNKPGVSDTPDLMCSGAHFGSAVPYNGSFSVIGLDASWVGTANTTSTDVFHEGIQQLVSGFTVGQLYTISFYQAVRGQTNAIDPSGSWEVFLDNIQVGVSSPTSIPSIPSGANPTLTWERRSITFTATSTIHTVKILPKDDDADLRFSYEDFTTPSNSVYYPNGALRMALDSVTLIQGGSSLPVEMVSFSGELVDNKAMLSWEVDTEIENEWFHVEFSHDGIHWARVGSVKGAGTSTNNTIYDFTHGEIITGTNYYRLAQESTYGDLSYSSVIAIENEQKEANNTFQVFPIPSRDYVQIQTYGGHIISNIRLLTTHGKRVSVEPLTLNGNAALNVQSLTAGMYILQFKMNGVDQQKKIFVK